MSRRYWPASLISCYLSEGEIRSENCCFERFTSICCWRRRRNWQALRRFEHYLRWDSPYCRDLPRPKRRLDLREGISSNTFRDLNGKHGRAYFELSATDGEQVTDLFAVAIRLIQRRTTISSDPNATGSFDRHRFAIQPPSTLRAGGRASWVEKFNWANSSP